MTRSANEVQTLIAKAARGAGAPAGQAAAFGKAAVCHLVAGRSEDDLTRALDALPNGPVLTLPLDLSRLLETAHEGIAKGGLVCVKAPKLAQSYADALPFDTVTTPTRTGILLGIYITKPAPRRDVVRVTLTPEFAEILTQLASKTLVPESDASRLAGAGAGLTDND